MKTIFEIDANRRTPKYLQIVHSVTKAIKQGRFKKGDRILSINELSNEFLLSRDTVQKAYDILEKDRVIEAVKGKGFYINRTDVLNHYKVLLIFNKLSSYKKMIYESFVKTLGKKGTVDLKIHHSNIKVFEDIVEQGLGEYDYYAIMPHFYSDIDKAVDIIKQIPLDQLIVMDKDLGCPLPYAAIYQDFENDITEAMETQLESFRKYDELIMVHPKISYPLEIINGFRKFCFQNSFKHKVLESVNENEKLEAKQVFVVIEETDLANIIKCCRYQNMKIGKDIGIVSYNDTPLKEILLDGISVISTDHSKMGETAATFILEQKIEKLRNPFRFIQRNSL
ncbi:MAG TPA: GntR family transcriptional regulator [Chitinophagaceae bacterium]|jgi:DNA-binding transcriptional regulator YhcF (GntR family)|nr:GntR family transcriptional regulator [Chitinophagaceae bacterium]